MRLQNSTIFGTYKLLTATSSAVQILSG